MRQRETLSVISETKGKPPRLPFALYTEAMLGKAYDLSIIFTDAAKMHALNKAYRGKDMPTDVLAFPISPAAGEIFIAESEAKKEAAKFDRTPENFLHFLLIHALAHLAGHDHGKGMEAFEARFRKKFGI